jgi:hypothetical protein
MARKSILAIVAEAEADLAAEVRDWIGERDPEWRATLRAWVRDDIATLRALRREADAHPARTYDMAG